MGIRGLTTYLGASNLGTGIVLEKCTVIVDCWALIHFIYQENELDRYYGGQSYFFHLAVQNFIRRLTRHSVKVIVMSDGAFKIETKEKTKMKRMNQFFERDTLYPYTRFSIEHYYSLIVSQICRENGIDFFVTSG
ncbi:hypothetical protein RF11_00831 [Thelohanellus kitauei]|uniref:XPG N-terminal domain-containing protein n=1 Tax=Thelohanellus kitauei TaxID=669202 RepID=A0A0C2MI89_THEKT|nr:hypothetical protein RF11_00831 [Thelohanellus kitauei]